jgi:hypothetical protein
LASIASLDIGTSRHRVPHNFPLADRDRLTTLLVVPGRR